MALQSNSILAVIPARGGSKSIPRKNLRHLVGKSLIEHAVNCALAIDWIDAVVISSDDQEILTHAKSIGIPYSITRPEHLSTDDAKSIDTWIHAWLEAEKHYKQKFDLSILLEPTSPMRTADDIEKAVQLLIEIQEADSVATISTTPGHYTPHKTLQISEQGTIKPYLTNGIQYSIRQHIPSYYHRNGICYAVRRESLINNHNLMEKNCFPLVISRTVINIDEEIDFKIAEFLMSDSNSNE